MRLLAQFLLVASELFEPLVQLDAAAKLIDQVSRPFGGRGEIGGVEIGEGLANLLVDAGGRMMCVLGVALMAADSSAGPRSAAFPAAAAA